MLGRSTLLHLSKSQSLKSFLTRFKSFNKVTKRFVAGEHLSDAIEAIHQLNRKGMTASFDHLGESITSAAATRDEVAEYIRLLDAVDKEALNSNISIKLTQLGLEIGPDFCYENTRRIVQKAAALGNFVRIDMEDSSKTDATIAVFKRLRSEFENVGIVIQAYLYRSEADIADLLASGSRIRLCKGAYSEPASVAFPKKSDVDANFVKLMRVLLSSGIYHGIATHDPKMISATRQFAAERRIVAEGFEFQMLFGVRRDLQDELVAKGYRMRIYVPYGLYWYPYFMRRLAERPANIWFVLKNMMRG
ncbi:MAG TPA: proline dehydrogenase family protein [Blastocatellia bacterium]|nr:proline dehydrogenase family protein [Blastocatellia bacterium]